MTSWGCAQSKEAFQDHWLVDNSIASAFGAYAIVTKMQAVQVETMEQSIRRARGQVLVWIFLCSLHSRIRDIVQPEDSHIPYQRNYCYIVSLANYPRKILMLISLFGHILKQVINMLFLPMICSYLMIYNFKKSLMQSIHENYKTALLLHLFPKWKVI